MEKERLAKLVFITYKATEEFPESEPLRIYIRQKALDVVSDYLIKQDNKAAVYSLFENLDALILYLEVAEKEEAEERTEENIYIPVLIKEYQQMQLEAQSLMKQEPSPVTRKSDIPRTGTTGTVSIAKKRTISVPGEEFLKARHKKIIGILKKRESAQIKDFKEVMPEVTKRTLRRDVDELLEKKLIERKGSRNSTIYVLKK